MDLDLHPMLQGAPTPVGEGDLQALDTAIREAERAIDELALNHWKRGQLLRTIGKDRDALVDLEAAYRYRSDNNIYAHAFAECARKLGKLQVAISVYDGILSPGVAATKPEYRRERAETLLNLGVVCKELHQFTEAEKAYLEAGELLKKLEANGPESYAPQRIACESNLAAVYQSQARASDAEERFLSAIAIARSLIEKQGEKFKPLLATVLNNLGHLYARIHRTDAARKVLVEAIELTRRLVQESVSDAEGLLGSGLLNFASLRNAMGDSDDALRAYRESLSIFTRLAERQPAHLLDAAKVEQGIGNIHKKRGEFADAESHYSAAISLLGSLPGADTATTNSLIATLAYSLGNVYLESDRLREARDSFVEAIRIQRTLVSAGRSEQSRLLALFLNSLGSYYYKTQWFKEAEAAYLESAALRRELLKADANTDLAELATTLNNLGILYGNTERISQAENVLIEALDMRRDLATADPGRYIEDLKRTLENLIEIRKFQNRTRDVEKYQDEYKQISGGALWIAEPPSSKLNEAPHPSDSVVVGQNPPPGIRLKPGSRVHMAVRRGAAPDWEKEEWSDEKIAARLEAWVGASLSPNIEQLQDDSYYFTSTIQQLGRIDCNLLREDRRIGRHIAAEGKSPIELGKSLDQFASSSLWVLGAFQLIYTLDKRMQIGKVKFHGLQPQIERVKKQFSRIRQPLAKMKAQESDYPYPYHAIRARGSVSWAINAWTIISRDELSEDLLGLLTAIANHTPPPATDAVPGT